LEPRNDDMTSHAGVIVIANCSPSQQAPMLITNPGVLEESATRNQIEIDIEDVLGSLDVDARNHPLSPASDSEDACRPNRSAAHAVGDRAELVADQLAIVSAWSRLKDSTASTGAPTCWAGTHAPTEVAPPTEDVAAGHGSHVAPDSYVPAGQAETARTGTATTAAHSINARARRCCWGIIAGRNEKEGSPREMRCQGGGPEGPPPRVLRCNQGAEVCVPARARGTARGIPPAWRMLKRR
jgi:hypothetical protein